MAAGFLLTVAIALNVLGSAASDQEALQSAKTLYASAAYEDALRALSRLSGGDVQAEAARYRVFCLIALGRTAEAEQAIQTVVDSDPLYVPDSAEVSPRIRELFVRTRQQLVPDIARRMYGEAKAALNRKDTAAAIAGFESLIRLIDGGGNGTEGELGELRFLAAGFLDLSRASGAPQRAVEQPSTAAVSPSASGSRPASPDIIPPVATRQPMPKWVPSDGLSRQAVFSGAIRVFISAAGRVERAEIVRPIHPAYDTSLLLSARSWEYQPARRAGVAVPSEQVVQIDLKPR
jgi:tetratricopeptide (TPR) repeat protein